MAIKQILFNTEMVQAILKGRKTQTRRIIKLPRGFSGHQVGESGNPDDPIGFMYPCGIKRPPCNKGDILWVRETWSTHYDGIHDDLQFCYKADGIDLQAECMPGESSRWYPSIHMPREAARIFLRVTNVRVERLQDITLVEVEAEGTDIDAWYEYDEWQHQVCDGCVEDGIPVTFETLRGFYGHRVWDNTMQSKEQYEKYCWDANPWVWVIEFEMAEKPQGWCNHD